MGSKDRPKHYLGGREGGRERGGREGERGEGGRERGDRGREGDDLVPLKVIVNQIRLQNIRTCVPNTVTA